MAKIVRWACWGAGLCLAGAAWAQQDVPAPTSWAQVAQAEFDRLDTNRDGRIDPEEYLADQKKIWAKYSNGSSMSLESCVQALLGTESQEPAPPEVVKHAMDGCTVLAKKGAKSLSWEDFAGPSWSFFKMMDANHDGFLSREEYEGQGMNSLAVKPRTRPLGERARRKMELDMKSQTVGRASESALASAQANPALDTPPGAAQAAPAQANPAPAPTPADRLSNWLR